MELHFAPRCLIVEDDEILTTVYVGGSREPIAGVHVVPHRAAGRSHPGIAPAPEREYGVSEWAIPKIGDVVRVLSAGAAVLFAITLPAAAQVSEPTRPRSAMTTSLPPPGRA